MAMVPSWQLRQAPEMPDARPAAVAIAALVELEYT